MVAVYDSQEDAHFAEGTVPMTASSDLFSVASSVTRRGARRQSRHAHGYRSFAIHHGSTRQGGGDRPLRNFRLKSVEDMMHLNAGATLRSGCRRL